MTMTRLTAATALLIAAMLPAGAHAQQLKVTFLGTGCPTPVMTRFGSSILVEAGQQKVLFDAGRGALQRLTEARVPWRDVNGVFLTHLHSDHVVGFPDLWLTGWLVTRRAAPLDVWGPRGTARMMSHIEQAYEADIQIRLNNERPPADGIAIRAHDIEAGTIYDKGGLKVTAFEVDHGLVKPAFGYRIDYGGRSVVLSGDTRVSENLIRAAQGVDVLVHEVLVADMLTRVGVPASMVPGIAAIHVTPEEAGKVFARANPKLAVYSHICPPAATADDLIPPARKAYAGRLEIAEDLMSIEVGPTIEVRKPSGPPR